MQQLKTITVVLIMSIVLLACSSIPITSMWKLRDADPLESDPAFLKLAVITHELVELKDNSTNISLELYSEEEPKHNFKTTVTALVEVGITETQLEPFRKDNERITLFSLDNDAVQQLRIAQSRIRATKEKNIPASASLNVNIDTACFTGSKPSTLNANIYISLDPTQGYVRLLSNIDLVKDDDDFLVACK